MNRQRHVPSDAAAPRMFPVHSAYLFQHWQEIEGSAVAPIHREPGSRLLKTVSRSGDCSDGRKRCPSDVFKCNSAGRHSSFGSIDADANLRSRSTTTTHGSSLYIVTTGFAVT